MSHWDEFLKITAEQPPSPLLLRALPFVPKRDSALDLGAGALRDTRFLLEDGFLEVVAVDSEPKVAEFARSLASPKLRYLTSKFEEFDFPLANYDLINAEWSLPFISPGSFDIVWERIKAALTKEGIFVGQLFGVNDEWNVLGRNMTFHTAEQVNQLLADLEILVLEEEEKDSTTANGTPKHWHVFHIIARKR